MIYLAFGFPESLYFQFDAFLSRFWILEGHLGILWIVRVLFLSFLLLPWHFLFFPFLSRIFQEDVKNTVMHPRDVQDSSRFLGLFQKTASGFSWETWIVLAGSIFLPLFYGSESQSVSEKTLISFVLVFSVSFFGMIEVGRIKTPLKSPILFRSGFWNLIFLYPLLALECSLSLWIAIFSLFFVFFHFCERDFFPKWLFRSENLHFPVVLFGAIAVLSFQKVFVWIFSIFLLASLLQRERKESWFFPLFLTLILICAYFFLALRPYDLLVLSWLSVVIFCLQIHFQKKEWLRLSAVLALFFYVFQIKIWVRDFTPQTQVKAKRGFPKLFRFSSGERAQHEGRTLYRSWPLKKLLQPEKQTWFLFNTPQLKDFQGYHFFLARKEDLKDRELALQDYMSKDAKRRFLFLADVQTKIFFGWSFEEICFPWQYNQWFETLNQMQGGFLLFTKENWQKEMQKEILNNFLRRFSDAEVILFPDAIFVSFGLPVSLQWAHEKLAAVIRLDSFLTLLSRFGNWQNISKNNSEKRGSEGFDVDWQTQSSDVLYKKIRAGILLEKFRKQGFLPGRKKDKKEQLELISDLLLDDQLPLASMLLRNILDYDSLNRELLLLLNALEGKEEEKRELDRLCRQGFDTLISRVEGDHFFTEQICTRWFVVRYPNLSLFVNGKDFPVSPYSLFNFSVDFYMQKSNPAELNKILEESPVFLHEKKVIQDFLESRAVPAEALLYQ